MSTPPATRHSTVAQNGAGVNVTGAIGQSAGDNFISGNAEFNVVGTLTNVGTQ